MSLIENLLRQYVKLIVSEKKSQRTSGSDPENNYHDDVTSDPIWKKRSIYVPKEDKDEIGHWLNDMGMTYNRKKNTPSK